MRPQRSKRARRVPGKRRGWGCRGLASCLLLAVLAGRVRKAALSLASSLAAAQAAVKCPRVMSPRQASSPAIGMSSSWPVHQGTLRSGPGIISNVPCPQRRCRDSAPSERGPPAWISPGQLRRPLKNQGPHCHVAATGSVLRERRAPTAASASPQFDCLISRPEADWMGRAFIGYRREKMPTCSGEIGTGWRSTIQSTPSEHGGVVSEPM